MTLKKRRRKRSVKKLADEVTAVTKSPREKPKELDMRKILSTGSTLLDLNVSGNRVRGGGIPAGIIVEIFGPSSAGKTALLVELSANAQYHGGDNLFLDPEARLDKEYSRLYGLELDKNNYERPSTVTEIFDIIGDWEPKAKKKKAVSIVCADSLAALTTDMEMEDGDAMGMRRAKEFSEGLRRTCRTIANNSWLVVCSNQEREGTKGTVTPGGKGIPYYSSLRIRVTPDYPSYKLKRVKTLKGKKKIEKVYGIRSICEVKKSSVGDPFRKAPIYIIFNHGIDDIRANLQWLKDVTGGDKYIAGGREFGLLDRAVKFVEDNDVEEELRETVIDAWEELEDYFSVDRKPKKRF